MVFGTIKTESRVTTKNFEFDQDRFIKCGIGSWRLGLLGTGGLSSLKDLLKKVRTFPRFPWRKLLGHHVDV